MLSITNYTENRSLQRKAARSRPSYHLQMIMPHQFITFLHFVSGNMALKTGASFLQLHALRQAVRVGKQWIKLFSIFGINCFRDSKQHKTFSAKSALLVE